MCTSDFQSDGAAQRTVTAVDIVLIIRNTIISGDRMNISTAIVIIIIVTSTRLDVVVVVIAVAAVFIIYGNSGRRR